MSNECIGGVLEVLLKFAAFRSHHPIQWCIMIIIVITAFLGGRSGALAEAVQ